MIEPEGRAPEPIQESAENDEVADETNRLPAPGSLLEAASLATLLLLRNIDGEFRIELLVGFQELLVLRIDGQRDGLLGFEELHGG
jgi:hypothetical protein